MDVASRQNSRGCQIICWETCYHDCTCSSQQISNYNYILFYRFWHSMYKVSLDILITGPFLLESQHISPHCHSILLALVSTLSSQSLYPLNSFPFFLQFSQNGTCSLGECNKVHTVSSSASWQRWTSPAKTSLPLMQIITQTSKLPCPYSSQDSKAIAPQWQRLSLIEVRWFGSDGCI